MENGNIDQKLKPIRVLIAVSRNEDASSIVAEIESVASPVLVRTVMARESCLQVMSSFHPDIVVATYDFGVFPFINDLREKHADIPFILISELELLHTAPKHGLNIYVLKHNLTRIPLWVNALVIAGAFGETNVEKAVALASFQRVISASSAQRPKSVHHETVKTRDGLRPEPAPHTYNIRVATDPTEKWTEELEQKMSQAQTKSKSKPKPARFDPLFPAAE